METADECLRYKALLVTNKKTDLKETKVEDEVSGRKDQIVKGVKIDDEGNEQQNTLVFRFVHARTTLCYFL